MNYILFHLIFTTPLLLILFYLRPALPSDRKKHFKIGLLLMTLTAVIYTTPWDAFLISQGVWFYGENVITHSLAGVPLGEYLFFVIQTIGTGLWLYYSGFDPSKTDKASIFGNLGLSIPFIAVTLLGVYLLSLGQGNYFYLGSILAWAGPVIALQWAFGGQKLLEQKRNFFKAVAIPTTYLWIIDRIALEQGLWTIATETRTGIELLGLPIEEAIFFLATNLMVVQGLILYEWIMKEKSSEK